MYHVKSQLCNGRPWWGNLFFALFINERQMNSRGGGRLRDALFSPRIYQGETRKGIHEERRRERNLEEMTLTRVSFWRIRIRHYHYRHLFQHRGKEKWRDISPSLAFLHTLQVYAFSRSPSHSFLFLSLFLSASLASFNGERTLR